MTVSATEFKTNMGKYIDYLSQSDEDIIVTKNGKKVMQISRPRISGTEKLASLVKHGNNKWDYVDLKKKAMEEKYEITL